MNRKILALTLGILLTLATSTVVLAGNDEDAITVDVGVSLITQITINPTSLSWSEVVPGSAGGVLFIDVKNTGSLNVTGMYAYVDTLTDESANPIGSDNPLSYAAGGVITLRRNVSGAEHYFAGRLEWNYTDWIELATLPSGAVSWGWFKNTSTEYLWGLVNGTPLNNTGNGGCNTTGTVFKMEADDDIGTAETRNANAGNAVSGSFVTGVRDWGLFTVSSGPLTGYCVATYVNCTKLYIYKYDRRNSGATNFVGCTNAAFLNTTNSTGPNEIQTINLDSWVQYGMPTGSLNQATLTVYAES